MNQAWLYPLGALSALALALGVGCDAGAAATSTDDGGTDGDGATSGDGGSASLAQALNDGYMKATWASGVTITYGECTLRFVSNGLPNHKRDAEYAIPSQGAMVPGPATATAMADPTKAQSFDITFNTCAGLSATTTATPMGDIGFMISGSGLFNAYEGDGTTVALASNFSVKGTDGVTDVFFVDSCNGHPTPTVGEYHYHGLPGCVTSQVDTAGGPSHIIGVALDGYPIYGNRDMDGKEITSADLDACNGVTSKTPEFPDGIYHYVLLETKDGTSAMKCFKGAVVTSAGGGGGGGPPGGGPPGGGPPADGG